MRWNVAVAGLAAAWGFISVIVAGVELEAAVLVFLRLVLAAAAIALALVAARRVSLLAPPERPWRLLVLGLVLAAHWFLFFETIKRSSVALAVLTVYTAPILLALFAPAFLPERRSRVALAALAPASAGIALIVVAGGGETRASAGAVALGIGAAVTYAVLVTATKRLVGGIAATTITFWTYVVAGVCLAPFLLSAERITPSGAEIAYVLVLGVAFTAVSGSLFVSLLRRVTAQAAGLLSYVEPVAAALLAWAILDQPLGAPVLAGGALVVLAGAAVVVAAPAEPAPVEAPISPAAG